ncbi:hypothetical protein DFP73DRAFT_524982 [Morchella snyderi]|nr:hypothetical protein DFP73DRAFT_524982 [Morchella snyderi]
MDWMYQLTGGDSSLTAACYSNQTLRLPYWEPPIHNIDLDYSLTETGPIAYENDPEESAALEERDHIFSIRIALCDTVSSVFCKLCWKGFRDIEKHNRTRTHLKGHEVRCNRCVSERWFSSKGARKRHMASNTCSEYDEHRCCDCDISFPTAKLLSRHKKDITIHPPRAVPAHIEHNGNIADLSTYLSTVTLTPHVGPTECPGLGCNRLFSKPFAMLTHIESGFCRSKINRELIDNIIIANDPTYIITNQDAVEERAQDRISLASSEYSDSINGSGQLTPSDMDSNFEEFDSDVLTDDSRSEGTIVPHNRSRALYPDSDSDSDSDSDEGFHFVTEIDVQHHAHLNTPSDSGESHGHSFMSSDGGESGSYLQTPSDSDNGVYFTPSDSEDGVYLTPSDSESGVYLTPSNSEISEDAINQILSLSGGSGLFTPPTDSIASPLQPTSIKCPLCPTTIKAKEFANLEGLHTHLRSMVHQQKIYHCPFPDTPTRDTTVGGGGKAGKRKKGENKQILKSFSALSALGQHVDAGSCKNGKDRFEATVAFLHEKLKEMGVADV